VCVQATSGEGKETRVGRRDHGGRGELGSYGTAEGEGAHLPLSHTLFLALLAHELTMPFVQILLLSGPPGLGKTTLAQIVATQAGYEVLEINARFVELPFSDLFVSELTLLWLLATVTIARPPR